LFAETGVTPRSVAEVEDIAQAWSLVQTGIGVSVVDPFSALHGMFPGVEARPLDSNILLTLDALLPRRRPISGLTKAFLADIAAALHG
jgi:DNA-binding transcriptional LysR family regulator